MRKIVVISEPKAEKIKSAFEGAGLEGFSFAEMPSGLIRIRTPFWRPCGEAIDLFVRMPHDKHVDLSDLDETNRWIHDNLAFKEGFSEACSLFLSPFCDVSKPDSLKVSIGGDSAIESIPKNAIRLLVKIVGICNMADILVQLHDEVDNNEEELQD